MNDIQGLRQIGQKTRALPGLPRSAAVMAFSSASACGPASSACPIPSIDALAAAIVHGKLTQTGTPAAISDWKSSRLFSSAFASTSSGRSSMIRVRSGFLVPPTVGSLATTSGGSTQYSVTPTSRSLRSRAHTNSVRLGTRLTIRRGGVARSTRRPRSSVRLRHTRSVPWFGVNGRYDQGAIQRTDLCARRTSRRRESEWLGSGGSAGAVQEGDARGRHQCGGHRCDQQAAHGRGAPATAPTLRARARRSAAHRARLVARTRTASQTLRWSHPSTPLYQRRPSARTRRLCSARANQARPVDP